MAEDLSMILTESGLRAFLENHRREAMKAYDIEHEAAAILRVGIERMHGAKLLGGLDQKRLARRITKPLFYAADLNEARAKALSTVWAVYQATVAAPKTDRKAFDPTK
jgi:hypothetical protein